MKPLIVLLSAVASLFAEDIFIAQTDKGNASGNSAANARVFTWFNSSGNWSSAVASDGKIGPGDTVHVVGLINLTGTSPSSSNQLQFQAGGTPSNPIRLKFDAGGRLRHPTGLSTGLVTASGAAIHDIVIEGANAGPVKAGTTQIDLEVFDNGTNLGNQVDGNRIIFVDTTGSNITLKNLYLYGAYVRAYASTTDPHVSANIVTLKGRHNLLIDNCKAEHGEGGFGMTGVGPGENTNLQIINSVVLATSTAIKIGVNSGAVNNGVNISGNRLDGFGYWSGRASPNQHHCDGIQSITAGTNQEQKNMTVAYNEIGPDLGLYGSMNAHIFLEDNVHGLYVFNNLLTANSTPVNPLQTSGSFPNGVPPGTANGFITAASYPSQFSKSTGLRSYIYNNTLIGSGAGQGITTSFATVKGNIINNTGSMININGNQADSPTHGKYVDSDYNICFNAKGEYQFGVAGGAGNGVYNSLASWQNPPSGIQGWDQHSIIANPKTTFPTGVLQSGSPAIGFAPTQTLFTDDLNRVARVVPWDAGALKYGSVAGPTPTPAPTATPTPGPTPPPPVLSFALFWNSVASASSYVVYEGGTAIAETPNTTYPLAGKVGPKNYQVSGKNSSGEGAKSNQVTLPAPAPSPTPPAPTATPVPVPAAPVLEIRQQ